MASAQPRLLKLFFYDSKLDAIHQNQDPKPWCNNFNFFQKHLCFSDSFSFTGHDKTLWT